MEKLMTLALLAITAPKALRIFDFLSFVGKLFAQKCIQDGNVSVQAQNIVNVRVGSPHIIHRMFLKGVTHRIMDRCKESDPDDEYKRILVCNYAFNLQKTTTVFRISTFWIIQNFRSVLHL